MGGSGRCLRQREETERQKTQRQREDRDVERQEADTRQGQVCGHLTVMPLLCGPGLRLSRHGGREGGRGGQGKKGPAQAGAQCFHPQMRKWAESSKAVPRGTSGSQDKNPPVRPHDTPHPTPRMRPRRELPSLSLSPQGSRTGLAILRCSKAGGSFLPRVGWTLL